MRHLVFDDTGNYPIVILVNQIRKDEIIREYLTPWDIEKESVMVLDLHQQPGKKKTPVSEIKEYIEEELKQTIIDAKAKYIICSDSEYYKVLSKEKKAEANLGYVKTSIINGIPIFYVPNYQAVFYDPAKVRGKIAQSMDALVAHANDEYEEPGENIIKFAAYPKTTAEIAGWLEMLLEAEKPLAIDIEAFSLKHWDAGIGTITFCWSQHEGIAFPVDYKAIPGATVAPFGMNVVNHEVRALLKNFFIRFLNKSIYHNISYDVYVLIYQLFMENIIDTAGLLDGMDVMLRHWDCTKVISYLATNTCAGNELGLKKQAQEFAGNYAQDDIKDITKIPLDQLLEYNLVDGLSTWYTHNKNYPIMVADKQEDVYLNIFKPATEDVIQMQLTGMPMNMETTKKVNIELNKQRDDALKAVLDSVLVQEYRYTQAEQWVVKRNAKLKTKVETVGNYKKDFNPNSDQQLQGFLYEHIGLPVIELTDSKLPATGQKVLKALKNHTKDQRVIDVLSALMDFKAVDKIVTAFMPAFLDAVPGPDGWHYLFGNLNIGGTVSGRLSSSEPNLQTIPSGSKYAKLIKSCFEAPPGWLFVGLDFASLEDRISALQTKDPNKLKVYTDGYDGHCLRAYAYFKELMPDIDPTSVESINSIAELYEALRGKSKAPTFLLTYQGKHYGLMKNCGFSEEEALKIYQRYHELYPVAGQWVQDRLDQAAKDGYVTAAFGLRVRTPLLAQVIRGNRVTPQAAEQEGRTAGNALGQSWCLLNNRAGSEFMRKVRKSELRLDIRPSVHIHDAQYFMIRDNIDTVMYVNEHLVKAVQWQNHPEIQNNDVHLGGELSIFYPTWAKEIEIPNYATEQQVYDSIEKAFAA